MKLSSTRIIILTILFLGLIYRLYISSNGNFIFNMDNARDMVDVREMVILHHPRLIGQTTSIDGVFYGPAWYYILAIPFILSGGNPYGSIIMEIILWAVGGYFLLFLSQKFYGWIATLVVACFWIASNFILLGSQYAFNPNPILFLTPLFIFLLWKYIETGKSLFNLGSWFLSGLFLHFEVTVGLFMPIVIVLSILLTKKKLLTQKQFYFGILIFLLTLLPQIIFELRHSFFMTKSLFIYHSGSHGEVDTTPVIRVMTLWKSYYDTLLPTLMNFKFFTNLFLLLLIGFSFFSLKVKKNFDKITIISLLLILIPLICLIPLKVDIMRWYLNGAMVASLLLVGWVIKEIGPPSPRFRRVKKIISLSILIVVFTFTVNNMKEYILAAKNGDPGNSIFRNEIAAVDYTYQKAAGKNFKAYVYMPSVLDYPYQYLFWWRGLNKYDYLPEDYAYLPGKPQYIKQKEKLITGSNPPDSGLIFLIKEPDRADLRDLWENSFKNLELLNTEKIGSITIETRREKSP